MMDYHTIVMLAWTILAALTALLAAWLIRWAYRRRHSEITRKAATKVFRMHGGIRGWKVITDVTLGEGADAVVVDQLVVGPFGVIVACDLHQKGKVYGDLTANEWIIANGEEGTETKVRIPSPYHRAELAIQQLRLLFSQKKIYNVPIELLVPKTQNQASYITGSLPTLIDVRKLKTQLEKSHYEKDNKVDVEAIAALFQA